VLEGGAELAGAELAGVGAAVRVSALGWLAALLQPVASSNEPQAAAEVKSLHHSLAGADIRVTTTVWPERSRRISCPKIR
jgi:hypothetical protein